MGRVEEREALRQDWVSRVPRFYSPWIHLAFTVLLGPAVIALALSRLQHPTWLQSLTVPGVLVFQNAFEWYVHKLALHRPLPGLHVLYKEHTLQHHRLYRTEDMPIREWREFRFVLLPPSGIVLLILVIVPAGLLLEHFGYRNVGMFWVATAVASMVMYEWLHLSYHLPVGHPIGELSLIKRLSHHHAVHHNPERMGKWNMNVTIPLWDWVNGTIYKEK
jgi:hypothetical protein